MKKIFIIISVLLVGILAGLVAKTMLYTFSNPKLTSTQVFLNNWGDYIIAVFGAILLPVTISKIE